MKKISPFPAACYFAISPQYLLITLLLLLLNGCQKAENPTASLAAKAAPPPAKVKIAQPLTQQVTEWDEYTGRIEAVNSVDVRARVSGYLEKVNFTAGAAVKKGDLLFVIDSRPFKAKLNYAIAELERTKSQQELAKNDLARAQNLLKAKAISTEEYDTRNKSVKEAAAVIQSAQAQVDSAQLNMQFTEVRAPINGRISQELITAGNTVNGGDMDPTRLATIVSMNPVYVAMDVDERAILSYRREAQKQGRKLEGTKLELALADEQGFPHLGKLDYVAPMENPTTGTIAVRGVFDNQDELLSPGFFARLRIRGGAAYPALLLPDRAIGTDMANRFVWVMSSDQKVTQRNVVVGKKVAELRVISQGLQAGEWVVIEGVQKLKPDSQIVPEKITLTTAEH
jgi:membrane fusion protein, multidrug efflux system